MSQFFPETEDDMPLPLQPLSATPDVALPLEEHMATLALIEEATKAVKGQPPPVDTLPDYYDDLLMQLIDAVPLE